MTSVARWGAWAGRLTGALVTCAVCVLAAPVHGATFDYDDPPQGVFFDYWSKILLNGQKCGYSHIAFCREGDVVKTNMLQTFRLDRAGISMAMTQTMTTDETVDGRPLAFTTDSVTAEEKVRQVGVIREGKVAIRSEQLGEVLNETMDYPPGAMMTWATERFLKRQGYTPGTQYEVPSYIPLLVTSEAVTMKVRIGEAEDIQTGEGTHRVIRTVQEVVLPNMPIGLESIVWLDPVDKQPCKTVLNFMGAFQMEMLTCSREEAVADFDAPEAFMGTLVAVDKSIDRDTAGRIRMKLSVEGAGPDMPALPTTGMQSPSEAGARSVILDVTRQDHAALAKATAAVKIDTRKFAEHLEPNIYINSDDPAVRKMADEAAGDAKAPYEIADRLRRYVSDTIADKNLTIGFATASEVCRNRSGDCSEHAVLLAALARAKGIPSRVACGLVYVPWFQGADRVFGFHLWTQVFVNGQWIDLDAAQNETDCNPTHVALAVSSLRDSGLGELAFAILPVMSRLKIEILEIEPAPGGMLSS